MKKIKISRRAFISLLPTLVFAKTNKSPINLIHNEMILYLPFSQKKPFKRGFFEFNLTTSKVREFETEIEIHQISYDPLNKTLIAVNKYGPDFFYSIQSDPNSKQFKKIDSRFELSGHAALSNQCPYYYFTAIDNSSKENFLIGVKKGSSEILDIVNLGSSKIPVHDCRFLPDSDTIVTTSSHFLHFYNTKSKKLNSHKFQLLNTENSLRHLEVNQKSEIVFQSNHIQLGSTYEYTHAEIGFFKNQKAELRSLKEKFPIVKDNELLDFSFTSDGQYVACVHGSTSYLTVWSTDSFSLHRSVQFPDKIVRVFAGQNSTEFYVVGREMIYHYNLNNLQISPLKYTNKFLRRSYSYGHKTLVHI